MWVEFPRDKNIYATEDQFMIGRRDLVWYQFTVVKERKTLKLCFEKMDFIVSASFFLSVVQKEFKKNPFYLLENLEHVHATVKNVEIKYVCVS